MYKTDSVLMTEVCQKSEAWRKTGRRLKSEVIH